MLRRPDDHRRDVRRAAPFAFAIAEPDQDRQLMTVAPHPASHRRSPSPPAARRNTSATPARGRQSSCDRGQRLAPAHRRHRKRPAVAASDEDTERPRPPTPRSPAVRDPQIPIGALAKRSPYLPAVSSLGGFRAPAPGPVPPSQRAGARNPSPTETSTAANRECPLHVDSSSRLKRLKCARSGRCGRCDERVNSTRSGSPGWRPVWKERACERSFRPKQADWGRHFR